MRLNGTLAVIANGDRQEVVLQVRPLLVIAATDEATGLELVACAHTSAFEQPLCTDFWLVVPLQRRVERNGLLALVLNVHLQMVLQVFADAGQFMYDRNAQLFQPLWVTYARALENLRGGNRTTAQQHFATRASLLGLAFLLVADADGALTLEFDHVGDGAGFDGQVTALFGRVQVATSGGGAATFRRYEAVHRAEALLLVAVDVLGFWVTGLLARLYKSAVKRVIARFGSGHADGPVATVVVVRADIAGFALFEVGQTA